MNHVERFRAVMNFQPVDRLPRWEWAMWWDEKIANWKRQGLPAGLESVFEIAEYFGLDPYQQSETASFQVLPGRAGSMKGKQP